MHACNICVPPLSTTSLRPRSTSDAEFLYRPCPLVGQQITNAPEQRRLDRTGETAHFPVRCRAWVNYDDIKIAQHEIWNINVVER
jgi:hypothetical protein